MKLPRWVLLSSLALVACDESAASQVSTADLGLGGASSTPRDPSNEIKGGAAGGATNVEPAVVPVDPGPPVSCVPYTTDSACGSAQTCLAATADGRTGTCRDIGTKTAGQGCNHSLVHTGCVAGLVCAIEPHESHSHSYCRPVCDPLATEASCPVGFLCAAGPLVGGVTGACVRKHAWADPAQIDQPCAVGAKSGSPCAAEPARAYRGVCAPDTSTGLLVCRALCSINASTCTAPTACLDSVGWNALGTCGEQP